VISPIDPISRRQLNLAGIAGAAVGLAWSSGLVWATQVHIPTIDVVGMDDSQLLLLDTGAERVLILTGPPHADLTETLSDVLGLFRKRIDVVFGKQAVLESQLALLDRKWEPGIIISLAEDEGRASSRVATVIGGPFVLTLSHGVTLCCMRATRYSADQPGAEPGWRIEVRRGVNVVGISESIDHLAAVPVEPYTLAIAATGSISLAERRSVAMSYAVNTRVIDEQVALAQPGTTLIRVFDGESARFELREGGVRMPSWAFTIEAT
jgi:hypothetical protein